MATRTDSARHDLALAILRAAVGVVFVAHGGQKLFVYGLDGVAGGFAQMGVPAAGVLGPLTGLVELLGGLALITGLLTRLAGLGLSIVMLGAIFIAHLAAGFFAPNGFEFPLTLLGGSLALAFAGAGRYSLDHVIATRRAAPARATNAIGVRRAA